MKIYAKLNGFSHALRGLFLSFLTLLTLSPQATAQATCSLAQNYDDRTIRIMSQADISTKRQEIIFAIWNNNQFPARSDVATPPGTTSPIPITVPNVSFQTLQVPMSGVVLAGSPPRLSI